MRSTRTTPAVLLAIGLLIAACGSSGTATPASSPTTEPSSENSATTIAVTDTNQTASSPAGTPAPANSAITTGRTTSDAPITPERDATIGPDELAAAIDDVVVVDVRSPDAYAAGHVAGAINISADLLNAPSTDGVVYQLADLEAGATLLGNAGIDADSPVVVYDDDQGVYAARAYFALTYWGHSDVQLLDGAFSGWMAAGLPVSDETVTNDPVEHPVAAEPGANRLLFTDVDDARRGSTASFLDARAAGEFDGSTLFGGEAGGHIPGATNIEWSDALDDDGFFRSADDLRTLYAEGGFLHDDGPVITYCYIGVRASHSWFVLSELLGYPDVGMYDGSWADYGNVPGAEIAT